MALEEAAEFAFIARHFAPLAGEAALGLKDDAAVLRPREGMALVVAADAMIEGVHFLPSDPAFDLGRKLLRVNLSDLAAMGAFPVGYLMTIAIPPGRGDDFFAGFAAGLAQDQARFGVRLLGGDTTSTAGPLALSLTILGEVAAGGEVRRSGARDGDGLFVTGTIGDAGLGLRALRGEIADPDGGYARAYRLPEPMLGVASAGLVHAAIDVSDGLLQDAGHLARASGLAVEIERALVPLAAGAAALGAWAGPFCLSCGDDYALLMAAEAGSEELLRARAGANGRALTRIGRFRTGSGLTVLDEAGRSVAFERGGWSHL